MLTLQHNPTNTDNKDKYYITVYVSNGKKYYILSTPIDDSFYEENLSSSMNYQYYYGEPNYI